MPRPPRTTAGVARPRAAAVVVGALLVLAACAAAPPRGGRPQGGRAGPAHDGIVDASYDWHGLVPAPFGTLLKESHIALHEVVLFRDESRTAADADSKDCYGIDGPPPRFVGRQADEYLLCFEHDRLSRIDASVRVSGEDAAQVFARACTLWLKDSVPRQAMGDTCEGRDGAIAFSARLSRVPGESAASSLSLQLSKAAAGEAVRDAPGAAPRAAPAEQ